MSVYNDIINQGVYYNKSRDDVMKTLSQNNALNTKSLSMLDSLYKEEEEPKQQDSFNIDQTDLTASDKQSYNYGTRMMQSNDVISKMEGDIASKKGFAILEQAIDEKQAGTTLGQQFVGEEFHQ